jgi:2-dehydro-3-deoxygalactonokinase
MRTDVPRRPPSGDEQNVPHLIAVDWGTSSLRGARLDETGRVLEEKGAPLGILNVPNGDFAGVFAAQFSDWMKPAGSACLISGMAGSRQGWVEAPYVACPAGPDELSRHLHWIEPGRIALVPGLSDEQGDVPDVMRGEEVQIFGAMRLSGLADGLFVLPGTHSKWATVQGGRITGFRTFMTGEFYGLLSQHSILARTLEADAPLDEAVFLRGVARAGDGQGLLHNAFGVRALGLFGRLSPAESASYLSGLLIGEELRLQELPSGREVIVIGAAALTARYALALGQRGAGVHSFGAEATWAGLRALQG